VFTNLTRKWRLQRIAPVLGLALFGAALWVLHNALRDFRYHDIAHQFQALPASRVIIAVTLTALSYLVMTAYDHLAITYIGHPLSAGKVSVTSFISYAFSNNIGMSLLTSGSIRYRLYSAWGLSTDEIAKVVAFTTLTLWLGIIGAGSMVFLIEPQAVPALPHLPAGSLWGLGLLFLAMVLGYLLLVSWRRTPFQLLGWSLKLPSLPLALGQLVVGALDWIIAGSVLYCLLPAAIDISFFHLLGIFLLAQVVALISHVPGGLGVFESLIVLSAPQAPTDTLLGALLMYRAVYYLLPLAIAALLVGGNELLQKKTAVAFAARLASRWASALVPQLLAASTLAGGAILLFSGATPAIPERLHWLEDFLPLPVMEVSHFIGSLAGVGLLLLARGLQRRLDAAYILSAILLAAGSLLSLLKGGDYEEALLLALMLMALLPCHRHFYRRTSLLNEPFTIDWVMMIALIVIGSGWLGIFAYKHVAFSQELWWRFALRGDAPRFLRAAVGATVVLLLFAVTKLLRPATPEPALPGPVELEKAERVVASARETTANLALLGDKDLLFNESETAFIMYAIEGRSWVALGDPVGPKPEQRELVWRFREMCELHGGWPVFYEVGPDTLPLYLDLGLTAIKVGEAARVPLAEFSLTGSSRQGLRYILRRLAKDGCTFEITPASAVPALLPELKTISDTWLAAKHTREKGFSLGFFDPGYLSRFPVALVRREGRIVAFANLWTREDREELSLDLVRFLDQALPGTMDYLFVNLILWAKEEGYTWFSLGMAPLAGLENRAFAPLWQRVGAMVFRHGEHFYNFQGLREYKDKFSPIWEPRYLASPGGIILPRVLTNIATLISGGLRGVVGK
jgi:phosphatidylglycerol lysyltransferase